MLKKIFLFATLILFVFFSDAQPLYRWADGLPGFTTYGLGDQNQAWQMSVNKKSEVYVVGYFYRGLDMDPGPGIDSVYCNSVTAIPGYVGKYDSSGNMIWGYTICGGSPQACYTDDSGFFYMAGFVSGLDTFGLNYGGDTLTGTGMFIAKYDSNDHLIWVKVTPTPTSNNNIFAIKVDHSGYIYVAGEIDGTIDMDPAHPGTVVFGTYQLDGFVAKYDPTGNLVWARQIRGNDGDKCNGLDLDPSGNVLVTGYTGGLSPATTFGDTGGYYRSVTTNSPNYDGFVAKYTNDGAVVWLKSLEGGYETYGLSVMADSKGNVYATGSYYYWMSTDSGSHDTLNAGGDMNGYLIKYTASGNLVTARSYGCDTGNSHYSSGISLAKDDSDNVYFTGNFQGSISLNPLSPPVAQVSVRNGGMDYFVLKLDSALNFKWDMHIFNKWDAEPSQIYLDGNNSVYVCGYIADTTNFNPLGTGSSVSFPMPNPNWTPVSFFSKYEQPKPVTKTKSGITQVQNTEYIVYPNPATNELIIENASPGAAIRLFTSMGQQVYTGTIISRTQPINISNLSPGVFLLQIIDNKGNRTNKTIVKQ